MLAEVTVQMTVIVVGLLAAVVAFFVRCVQKGNGPVDYRKNKEQHPSSGFPRSARKY